MTLNQVLIRLEKLALSHKQLKHFFFGDITEWLENKDNKYPSCFVELNDSQISKTDHMTKYNFSIWFCDLLNVSKDARSNELELLSDLTSIAEDYIAMLNFYLYQDEWTIDEEYKVQYFKEELTDIVVAVKIDLQIGVEFTADRCRVPATGLVFVPQGPGSGANYQVVNFINNYVYEGQGTEGTQLSVQSLAGKEILMLWKGDKLLKQVESNPGVNEFSLVGPLFTFGTDIEQEQVLQILFQTT